MERNHYNSTNRYNNTVAYADVARMRARTLKMMGVEEDTYVDGNTVRVAEPAYEPAHMEPEKKGKSHRRERHAEENRVNYSGKSLSQSMNALGTLALVAALVFTLVFCVKYLQIQSEISEKTEYITQLKKNITTITTQNDAVDYSINSYVDINNVYKIATEEMGMVVAGEDQVKIYDSTELEYMKQFADIPSK